MKVAYLMSRYPKITETFILNEVIALQAIGVDVSLFPLQKEKTEVIHPKAVSLMPKVTFTPLLSWSIFIALCQMFVKHPIKLISTFSKVIRFNWGCNNFLLGAIAFFPKAVYLVAVFKQLKIEHVHAHFANHPTMVAFVINQLSGISYSFTAHGSDLHKRQHMLREKFDAAKFAVMISNYNQAFFYNHTKINKSDKLHIVRCGVDTQTFTPKPNNSTVLTNILCVASLREVKGHRYLIDACAILKESNIPFHLTLIGDGPMRSLLESQVASLKLSDHITVLGAQAQEVIIDNLAKADIFALTSFQTTSGNREGIPVVIMEAMACAIPVVASDVSGIPELVIDGQTGLLCETQNPSNIAEKLTILCNDKTQREKMGQNGRDFVLSEFDLHKNAQKLASLFRYYSNH